jgi:zona occludens toxin
MITFLLGLPGSGKSYYAVDRIYNNFSADQEAKKDKKVTFQNCYTNINEFKYDKVKNVSQLDFEKLHEILTRLHSFTKGKNKKLDNYLLKYCEKVKIKDTLFVIDEAHNFFDKQDRVIVWWLSYHRHLHHEILLITQSLDLIFLKYKKFSEFFYVAKPQSLIFNKNFFKYNRFTQSRLSKASSIGAIKLKINPKVFELYKSGDSIDTPNVVLKYVLISVGILLSLIIFLYFFSFGSFSDSALDNPLKESSKKNTITKTYQNNKRYPIVKNVVNNDDIKESFSSRKFFKLFCTHKVCSNKGILIPSQLLANFIKEKSVKVLYKEKINKNLMIFHLDSSIDFYNYLIPQKENKNAKFNKKNSDNKLDLGFLPTVK